MEGEILAKGLTCLMGGVVAYIVFRALIDNVDWRHPMEELPMIAALILAAGVVAAIYIWLG